jgi:hypothetical protein
MVQHQFEKEPFPFCTGCHAPESDGIAPVPSGLSHLGVGCVTCHVVGDKILAAAVPHANAARASSAPSPHAITRTVGFDGAVGCGACHEFAFPEAAHGPRPLMMQSTMTEHAQSAFAGRSCASCHMPIVAGPRAGAHKSHRFAASRDEAVVRSAIRVEAGPFVEGTLVLTLHAGEVGHAFPTGDMLRRLALRIDVLDATGRPVEHAEHHFKRHFGFAREPFKAPRKVIVKDDRVGASRSPVVFRYAARARPAGGHLRYTLRYERVSEPSGGAEGEAVVEGSILLAEGTLPLSPRPR